MASKKESAEPIIINESPDHETTYFVNGCVVKVKFRQTDHEDKSHVQTKQIRDMLLSSVGV